MTPFVGDRFVRLAGGWVDLVTGAQVALRMGRIPDDVESRLRQSEAVIEMVPFGGTPLIDFGRTGADGWFEATPLRAAIESSAFRLKKLPQPAVATVVSLAADPLWHGPKHLYLVAPAGSGCRTAMQDLARALRTLGFVSLRSDLPLPRDLRQHLRHRHLALLVMTDDARAAAAEWSSHLCVTSDRGHLLIERVALSNPPGPATVRLAIHESSDLVAAYVAGSQALTPRHVSEAAVASAGWPGRFARELARRHATAESRSPIGIARERLTTTGLPPVAGQWPFSVSLPHSAAAVPQPPMRLIARAVSSHRRGRVESSARWLAAGLESSRRRGDPLCLVRTLEEWVPRLIRAGRSHKAAALASRALADAIEPTVRARIARLAATAYLESAQLSRAETCIDTALCIEQLTERGATDASLALRAAIRLWQGRWREGCAEIAALPAERLRTPVIATWRELLMWADGDDARRWAGAGEAVDDRWTCGVRAFRAAATGISSRLIRALELPGIGVGTTDGDARDGNWRRVIAAQAWLDLGDVTRATEALGSLAPVRVDRRGLLDCALISLRRSLRLSSADDERWLDGMIVGEGLRGVVRWGQGRTDMQMLRDVSELLEIVQASDDETTGLNQVCAWLRTTSGASACGIVAAPAAEVMVGSGLAALGVDRAHVLTWLDRPGVSLEEGDTEARARAPIRYLGTVVGLVLGVAPAARARPLLGAVQAAAAVSGALVRARLDAAATSVQTDLLARQILGASPAIQAVRAAAARAAAAPFSVVIEGESGTGKELVARAVHTLGPRRDRAFAALNCAALTDELVEAELFGHARGAFTHAVNARAGLFEEAHQGTLFLDEVGELSPRAQAKLLRVLQEGEIRRVGENESRTVDVRVVAASNRPLATLVAEGRFRDDLMFRLAVVRIHVPPLRERSGDVPPLAMAFWKQAAQRVGTRAVLGPDALLFLAQHSWPGNVRQLQNAMAAVAVAAPTTGRVSERLVRHVVHEIAPIRGVRDATDDGPIVPLDEARRDVERRLVSAAIAKHSGSRARAALALGLSRQGLSRAMRRLGVAEAGVA